MARPRLVSDDEIRSAVRKGVLEQGPQVSLDLIAERLGVTAPALFKRFGSRNALLLASLALPDHPRVVDLLESEPDERPFETQLHEIIEAHMQFLDEGWPCMAALRESGIPKEQIKDLFAKNPVMKALPLFVRWLERCKRLGLADIADAQHVAIAVFGSAQQPIMMRHMSKHIGVAPPSVEGYARSVSKMIARGLAPRRKTLQ